MDVFQVRKVQSAHGHDRHAQRVIGAAVLSEGLSRGPQDPKHARPVKPLPVAMFAEIHRVITLAEPNVAVRCVIAHSLHRPRCDRPGIGQPDSGRRLAGARGWALGAGRLHPQPPQPRTRPRGSPVVSPTPGSSSPRAPSRSFPAPSLQPPAPDWRALRAGCRMSASARTVFQTGLGAVDDDEPAPVCVRRRRGPSGVGPRR